MTTAYWRPTRPQLISSAFAAVVATTIVTFGYTLVVHFPSWAWVAGWVAVSFLGCMIGHWRDRDRRAAR